MREIIPAIIGKNFTEVRDKIEEVGELTTWLHLDVADGKFVADKSWSVPDDLHEVNGRIKIEVHLMTEQPEETVADWVSVADRVIVHPESRIIWQKLWIRLKILLPKLAWRCF